MIKIVMSVRDRAADTFSQPMFLPAVGVGVRIFTDEVNRAAEGNQAYAHPEDFDLYELGTFDDSTGVFTCLDRPRQVAIGKDVAKRNEK